MRPPLLSLAPVALALAVYLAIAIAFVVAFYRARREAGVAVTSQAAHVVSVSILKPLAGIDDDLDANLASFGAIVHPEFEILFGVASPSDPALASARRFLEWHPHVRARIVVTDPGAARNPKVAQLLALEAAARGDVIVISDSNVRVPATYLATLVRPLEEPRVGLVTSIFAGTGEETLGAALENLQLGAVVTPGIVAYNLVSADPLTLGKSMAIRRRDLRAVGGFAEVGGVLAEDHALGRLVLAAGFEVRTSLAPVENRNVTGGLLRTIERHSRWAKMRRALAPGHFALEPMLSPLSVATFMLALSPTRAQLVAVAVCALLQTVIGFASVRILRGHAMRWYYAPLEVARTYVALACWIAALASRRVVWRGHVFSVGAGSQLRPLPANRVPVKVRRRRDYA